MRPNSNALIGRDPAMAALFGLTGQADFGVDAYESAIQRTEALAEDDTRHGAYRNAEQLDRDAAMLLSDRPGHSDHWYASKLGINTATLARLKLMDPNFGSTEKIGHYSFTVTAAIVTGTSEGFTATNSPLCDIKPERMIFNVPCFNFALLSTVQIGNTSVLVGSQEDAFNYTATAVDVRLSMPLLRTSSRALVAGQYTGITIAPYTAGFEYSLIATFHGPARMNT